MVCWFHHLKPELRLSISIEYVVELPAHLMAVRAKREHMEGAEHNKNPLSGFLQGLTSSTQAPSCHFQLFPHLLSHRYMMDLLTRTELS